MFANFEYKNDGAIGRYIDQVHADTSADAGLARQFRERLTSITYQDHAYKLDGSVDRFGRRLAKLKPSTLKRRPRPKDKPLDPAGSRIRSGFVVRWDVATGDRWILVASFPGIDFAVYLLHGTRHMAARDIGGWSPRAFIQVGEAFSDYAKALGRSRSLRGRASAFFSSIGG